MALGTRALPVTALAIAIVIGGCDRCGGAAPADAGAPEAAATATPTPTESEAAPPDAAPAPEIDASAKPAREEPADAGATPCRLVYGPAEQPFRGPAALVVTPSELQLVANDAGKPRVFPVPISAPGARVTPPRPASFVGMRWPPCEVAGRFAYCQGPGGTIERTTLGKSDTKAIAKSRSGTRIAASTLGGDHAVVAFLDARRTTEGEMLQAFAVLDEGDPVRLSEEGAGATLVRMVPRGERAVAVYLDARMAMVPVHARTLSFGASGLALGDDAVVFVGGPPERGIDFALGGGARYLFALVPMARETSDFGMAAVPVSDPPKDDVPAVWSMYPNGLDPAPVAATTKPGEPGPAWVARVRPEAREPGSPRVLELGRIDATGAFSSLGVVARNVAITDLAMATDPFGAVWLLYGTTSVTWLERRVCP